MMLLPYWVECVIAIEKTQAFLHSAYKETSYSETSTEVDNMLYFRPRYLVQMKEKNPCKQIWVGH
jgi:hypothetical protein